jgi:diguanylate cyclase (GGDEF)-like protein/PAS domain S-box-containing protein
MAEKIKAHLLKELLEKHAAVNMAEEEKTLQASEIRYRRLFETAQDGILILDADTGEIGDVNPFLTDLLGYSKDELWGKKLWEIGPFKDIAASKEAYEELQTKEYIRYEDLPLETRDGQLRDVEFVSNVYQVNNKRVIQCNIRDITERKRTEEALLQLAAIVDSSDDAIVGKTLDGIIVSWNSGAEHIYGYTAEEVLGRPVSLLIPPDPDGKDETPSILERIRQGERIASYETVYRRKDGSLIDISLTISPVRNYTGKIIGASSISRDITERKKMEEIIRRQAYHDALTGLPNRMLFFDHLTLEIAVANRNRKKIAVMFMDLDNFKKINDTLGHIVGDKLLKEAANRLKACVREADTIARIGGDEFSILLADIIQPGDAVVISNKILESFKVPYVINEHEIHISTSIGISIYPQDGKQIDDLMKNADTAMYQAKEKGRNNFQFYNSDLNAVTHERITLENRMRQSIEHSELVVYYQPQVDIISRKINCAEALVRWQHPELGLLDPVHFLPLADETGFITSIDTWVLHTACAQVKAWQHAGVPPICISVNLSSRQFQNPNLVEIVSQVLKETDIDPRYLDLEISENVVMQDIDLTISNLTNLAALGVRFSIDDFGTGQSSISRLKKLPIQKIKIDKSIISDMAVIPDNKDIINAIIAMSHNLGLTVMAEGVESEDQVAFLRSGGCDEMQGYVFSKALPIEGFQELIKLKS